MRQLLIVGVMFLSSCVSQTGYLKLGEKSGKLYHESDITLVKESKSLTPFGLFVKHRHLAQKDGATEDEIRTFMKVGINLSNESCQKWFIGNYDVSSEINRYQSFFQLFQTLSVAALTFKNRSARTIGGASLLFDGIDQSYDFMRSNFLMKGSILILMNKVEKGRGESAKVFLARADNSRYDYHDAERDLLKYHTSCHPMVVASYVEGSLQNNELVPKPDAGLVERARLTRDMVEISGFFRETGILTDTNFKGIYFLAKGGAKVVETVKERNPEAVTFFKELEDLCSNGTCLDASREMEIEILTRISELGTEMGFDEQLSELEATLAEIALAEAGLAVAGENKKDQDGATFESLISLRDESDVDKQKSIFNSLSEGAQDLYEWSGSRIERGSGRSIEGFVFSTQLIDGLERSGDSDGEKQQLVNSYLASKNTLLNRFNYLYRKIPRREYEEDGSLSLEMVPKSRF